MPTHIYKLKILFSIMSGCGNMNKKEFNSPNVNRDKSRISGKSGLKNPGRN
jgi:hypothetical protein